MRKRPPTILTAEAELIAEAALLATEVDDHGIFRVDRPGDTAPLVIEPDLPKLIPAESRVPKAVAPKRVEPELPPTPPPPPAPGPRLGIREQPVVIGKIVKPQLFSQGGE